MRPTLLYDGRCRFCRFAARTIDRLDRDAQLAVLPFDDPAARELLAPIPERDRFASWHLVSDEGRASRGRGLAALAAELRATRRLAPVLRVLPLETIYALVAGSRSHLGRIVPDGPAPRRAP